MERTLSSRSVLGRVGRPFGLPALWGTLAEHRRAPFLAVWRGRRTRIALIAVLIALPLFGGGYLLLRNSSFVAVQRVQVSGVHGVEAKAIETALVAAARHMSTLNVHTGALLAAVAPFRIVSSIRAVPSFPHSLRIEVEEELPVAALLVNGSRTAVAANGVVLGPALLSSSLPTISGYFEPAPGQRLHNATLLESVAIMGAAPRSLLRHVAKVYEASEGLTVAMRNGLLVYFGDAVRPHAKWLSLARVLADHSSAGASYIDVRLPSRPAAGFPAGAGPVSSATVEESSTTESGSGSESAVGALAAGLSKEGGTSTTGTSSTGSTPPESSSESSEASSGESSETSTSTGSEATQETPSPGG